MRGATHLAFVAALGVAVPLAAQAPRAVAPTTIATFGGAVDDPAAELIDARQVVRLDDGRFVVVNGKPLAVRVYRANGRVERQLGAVGGGPGEYQGSAGLQYTSGDSVAVFSSSGRRWMLFRLDGELVREWTVPSHPGPVQSVTLQGNTVLRTGIPGSRGCAAPILRQWRGSATAPHDAMTDPWGRLWIRPIAQATWTVVDHGHRPIASVVLPGGFWATQFRGDTVVGLQVDDDGFSHVHAIATHVGAGQRSAGQDCTGGEIPVTPVRSAMLRTTLRNAMTYGESHRSRSGAYPSRPDMFPDGVAVADAEVLILAATRESWVLAVRDTPTGYHCLMSIGPDGLPGILDGVMRCGW